MKDQRETLLLRSTEREAVHYVVGGVLTLSTATCLTRSGLPNWGGSRVDRNPKSGLTGACPLLTEAAQRAKQPACRDVLTVARRPQTRFTTCLAHPTPARADG